MGAALYPVDKKNNEIEGGRNEVRERSKVTPFERPQDQNLLRAMGTISQLEAELTDLTAELRGLREALVRTQHKITRQDQLLRNAMVRERELRAQLGEKVG